MSNVHVLTISLNNHLVLSGYDQYSTETNGWSLVETPAYYAQGHIRGSEGYTEVRYWSPSPGDVDVAPDGVRLEFTYWGGAFDSDTPVLEVGKSDYRSTALYAIHLAGVAPGTEVAVEIRGVDARMSIAGAAWQAFEIDFPSWIEEEARMGLWRNAAVVLPRPPVGTVPGEEPFPEVIGISGWSIRNIRIYEIYGGDPEPEPGNAFWTRLVGVSEKLSAPGPSPEAGKTPETATVISSLPYSTTLGAISGTGVLWFKATLGAGAYRFHTTASPDPQGHDTHIALFSAAGAVVAENDDVSGEDYRSSITETLPAGDYYIALGSYGATVGSGFSFVPRGVPVAPGAIFRVEAA